MPAADARAGAAAAQPMLLASIHDVTPAHADAVSRLWRLCRRYAITPALLVVPNWHGQWPLDHHAAFVRWIHERVADGAEIFLHGERHDEAGLPRTLGASLRAVGRTAREGEFLTLDGPAARDRIVRGLQLFDQLGLQATGFVPPAWLAREATHRAAREAGLHFSEDAAGIRLLQADRRLAAPALRWSGRSAWRAAASSLVARARWRLHRAAPVVRLALHPMDFAHPRSAASVEREVARWAAHARATPYATLS